MIKKKILRLMVIAVVLITSVLLSISTALADAPENDDFDSATVIGGIPFNDSINTAEAVTAADDPDCVAPGSTVWYAFTPAENMNIEANTFGSDYDTTLSVYTGARGGLTQIACNDDTHSLQSRVRFDANAGETYFFMIGAFSGGSGGNLTFSVLVTPPPLPPLTIEVSIDPVGSVVPKTGVATIWGTVTCSRPAFASLNGQLKQKSGRGLIQTFFGPFVECNGPTPWSATITGINGPFAGGKATAFVFASGFDPEDGTSDFAEASETVQLRGSKP